MTIYKPVFSKPPQEVANHPEFQENMRGILTHEFHRILSQVNQEFPGLDQYVLNEAFLIDLSVQENLYRNSGVNSVTHPLAIFKILMENETLGNYLGNLGEEAVTDIFSAALLHDTLEEARYQEMDLEPLREKIEDLGGRTIDLVELLTKPEKEERPSLPKDQYQLMYIQGLGDMEHAKGTYYQVKRLDDEDGDGEYNPEVLKSARVVKAADIIHNLRTLYAFDEKRKKRFIDETRALWIPAFSVSNWGMPEIQSLLERECTEAENRQAEPKEEVRMYTVYEAA